MAIERTTSIAKIEVISRGGHLACKVLRVVESLILVSVLDRFLVHELVSRLYPRQEHKQTEPQSTTRNAQATWCKTCMICKIWYAMHMRAPEGKWWTSNLANQACHWKDEMISVEIDIKITGNGCTVCKWQAKQEWHDSAINSMIGLRIQSNYSTAPQHSNKAYGSNLQEMLDKRWTLSYG